MTTPLSGHDKTAVQALLTRYARAWKRRTEHNKLKVEIEAEIASDAAQSDLIKSALKVFGFDLTQGASAWQAIVEAIGEDDYNVAIDAGIKSAITLGHSPPLEIAPPSESRAEHPSDNQSNLNGVPIRQLTLDRLKHAGDSGVRAKEIREGVEAIRGTKIHDKTVGMTLYRLSNEGLARREGRTWFYVPPKSETQNPGGSTPGLFNAAKQEEGA